MAEQGMTPTNSVSSGNHLKSSYDQEQGHQVHAVTRDSLKAVTQEAGNMESWMNSQVANDVSGNANSGTIDMTMTFNHIADNSQELVGQGSVGYAAQQMVENNTTSGANSGSPANHLKSSYDQEQEHQVHVVTRDSINATAQESTNMETAMSGQTIRNQVDGTMAANRTEIDAKANQVQSRGDTITGKVKRNQNKGVNYRVAAKGAKEVANSGSEVWKAITGESQKK